MLPPGFPETVFPKLLRAGLFQKNLVTPRPWGAEPLQHKRDPDLFPLQV